MDSVVQRRPRVARLFLSLDPGWGGWGAGPSPSDRLRQRCLACSVLALLSGQRFELVLHSCVCGDWMPRLPRVSKAAVEVSGAGTDRECTA